MNQADIQAKVARGFALAAARLGAPTTQYRPTSALLPMQAAPHATLMAAFDQDGNLGLKKPAGWDKPFLFAMVDTTDTIAGDLMVSGTDTYFVARFEAMRPLSVVLTNRVVSILTEDATAGGTKIGWGGYSGQIASTDTVLATGWPAMMIPKTRGDADPDKLATDVREAHFEAWLPRIPGVTLTPGLRIADDIGASAIIETAELQPFGWHLMVLAAQA